MLIASFITVIQKKISKVTRLKKQIDNLRRNDDFVSDNEQDLRCGSSTVGSVSSTKTTITNLSL